MTSPGLTPPGYSGSEQVKVTVLLAKQQYDDLLERARAEGLTVSEALRRSIAAGLLMWGEAAGGSRILIEERSGRVREIKFIG